MTEVLEFRRIVEPAPSVEVDPRRDEARDILARHPLFQPLGAGDIARLVAGGRSFRRARGERVFARGEAGGELLLVLTGAIRVSVFARSGAEIVHNVIQAGEACGEVSLLDARPRSADAFALADCEFLAIGREATLKLLAGRPDVAANALIVLCERLRRACPQVEDALFLGTQSRLAHAILRQAQPVGGVELRLRATQKQLGEMIGLSRESTNKQLQIWVRRGWIEIEKGGVLVRDPAALANVASPQAD